MPAVAPCAVQGPGCSYTGRLQGLVPCVIILGERGAVRCVEVGGERLPAGVLCAVLATVGGGVSGARSPSPLSAEPMLQHRLCGCPGLSLPKALPVSPFLPGPCVESHTVGAVVSALGEPWMPRQSLSCSAESCPYWCRCLCHGLQNPVMSVPLTVCDTTVEPGRWPHVAHR